MSEIMSEMVAARFWAKVEKGDGCWNWGGTAGGRGYGTMSVNGRAKRATHVAVWLTSGEWPGADMVVCHRCDNPCCVRPDHLFVGTQSDNMRDCVSKRRHKFTKVPAEAKPRGERHGLAKLNADKVREIRASNESSHVLSARYGVHRKAICLIRNGETWRHVTETA